MSDLNASDSVQTAVDSVADAVRAGKPKGRPVDPNGRLGQARAIYNAATDRTRKTLIAEFTSKIAGMTKPVASAYYHQIVKAANKA